MHHYDRLKPENSYKKNNNKQGSDNSSVVKKKVWDRDDNKAQTNTLAH